MAVKLNLIKDEYGNFFKSTQDVILIPFTFSKERLSKKLIKYISIYISDDKDLAKYEKLLKNNQWISYEH